MLVLFVCSFVIGKLKQGEHTPTKTNIRNNEHAKTSFDEGGI